ncbi:hypothetical protein KM427_16080 [Nocardioides sp. LMS-CY]|nr:hypothetical protein [Nocardioides sp. LMS-CY]QWF20499.1 hypothetical protein KM427_16080 [Nocardioides sp. LMS-CY]
MAGAQRRIALGAIGALTAGWVLVEVRIAGVRSFLREGLTGLGGSTAR